MVVKMLLFGSFNVNFFLKLFSRKFNYVNIYPYYKNIANRQLENSQGTQGNNKNDFRFSERKIYDFDFLDETKPICENWIIR